MFSGIVRGVGRILDTRDEGGDRRIVIGHAGVDMPGPGVGASIAVNGVCLTAAAVGDDRFEADVSAETLAVTALGGCGRGAPVNLEPSLRLGDTVDGHLVSGHVDGVGRVAALAPAARSTTLTIELPPGLERFVAQKGSIAVDGVSLTVNRVAGSRFEVNVVPHTREHTIIGTYAVGAPVNVEVDMLARYVERMLSDRVSGRC
ncbi:MAG TPA: riboflavin synthase [Gammaproteobacteria bacterium]|nr:riboflavin synthase [Gammaproteobacteria bacterium]